MATLPEKPASSQALIYDPTSATGFRWITLPIFDGFAKITVSEIPPINPQINDLWIDIS